MKARSGWATFQRNMFFAVAMVTTLLITGCATNTDVSYSNPSYSAEDFDEAANRPPTARTLYALARILAAQGKDAECGFVLARIIREHPRFMPAYCDLAEFHLRHRRIEDAVAVISDGLGVSPSDPVLLNNLGMCRMLKSEYAEALSAFAHACAVMPHDARYGANMAAALGMLGRYEESLELYQQVIPTPDAHHNLGVLCEARQDFTRAALEFERARTAGFADTHSRATRPVETNPIASPVGDLQ